MGRQPCCDKVGLKKGPWTAEEDRKLLNFILANGQCCWRAVPKFAGLLRCGKSCRLRWTNYLRPDLKRGLLSDEEEMLVIDLHSRLGNRWSKIASHMPGRTDNEIKNHWNTHIKKKLKKMGIDPITHKPLIHPSDHQHIIKQPELEKNKESVDIVNISSPTAAVSGCSSVSEVTRRSTKSSEEPISLKIEETQINEVQNETEVLQPTSPMFCIDDVPMIQPHEMLVISAPSSVSNSSHNQGEEWRNSNDLHLWEMNQEMRRWEFITDEEESERKLGDCIDPDDQLAFDEWLKFEYFQYDLVD